MLVSCWPLSPRLKGHGLLLTLCVSLLTKAKQFSYTMIALGLVQSRKTRYSVMPFF